MAKPVDGIISINGQSGVSGQCGRNGGYGSSGYNGGTGCSGGDGGNGGHGYDGEPGYSGTDAQHALIALNGTADHLNVRLKTFLTVNEFQRHSAEMDWNALQHDHTYSYDFQLAQSKGIVLIEAIGGSGGNGGHGGNGGKGGSGGDGGHGRHGSDGHNTYAECSTGGAGGTGGSGGNGGRGGNGGNGGDGGQGGDAGIGGHMQIRSADPRLFMLADVNCRAGVKGQAGRGGQHGAGGPGGDGGRGGSGGAGGNGGPGGSRGNSGSSGYRGSDGSRGYPGRNGRDACEGRAANDGSIMYAVVDTYGHICETGSDIYHASVISYIITDENDDGIYEPDSDLFITDVKWINNGAMSMPDGAVLSFLSTAFIRHDTDDVSILPSANINEVLTDSHQFKCHINGVSVVGTNRPYIQPITLTSEITLLNRLFNGSVVTAPLISQYPIQITHIGIPTFLGPTEQAIVTVTFTNISSRPYGACADSAGAVEFMFSTHSLIKILPMNEECLYQILPDGRAWYKINEEITPGSSKSILFTIMLDADSAKVYYESLFWNIDLLLREKLIEKRYNGIRVVPTFRPDLRTDALLITNSKVDRAEFLAYQNLFKLFNYTNQTWSIERYGTLDNPEIKWLYTTDLVVFIYSNPETTFRAIKSDLFLQHIKSSEKAGFICIGACSPNELDFGLFDYTNLQYLNDKERATAEANNHLWSAFGCGQPTIEELVTKANKFRPAFEKRDDHRFLYQIVYDDTVDTSGGGIFTVVYGNKYVYKSTLNSELANRVIIVSSDQPLITTSHLPFTIPDSVDVDQLTTTDFSNEHRIEMEHIIESDIDLNSRFGRLLCAMLSYQGFTKAYRIISEQRELVTCTFRKISNRFSFHHILVALAMSTIEREYDRGSLEFPASEQLVREIANIIATENNTGGVNENGWFYLLIQALYEYTGSKFFSSFPWCCGCSVKSKQRSRLLQILNDLLSLTTTEIAKNKAIYPEVQMLKLQKLAALAFPIADVREICVRSLGTIYAWQTEQLTALNPLSPDPIEQV